MIQIGRIMNNSENNSRAKEVLINYFNSLDDSITSISIKQSDNSLYYTISANSYLDTREIDELKIYQATYVYHLVIDIMTSVEKDYVQIVIHLVSNYQTPQELELLQYFDDLYKRHQKNIKDIS